VANALLVSDLTLTLWIPGQALFASIGSYSSFVPIDVHETWQPVLSNSAFSVAHRILRKSSNWL